MLKNKIVLFGFAGCGTTTIGKLLSKELSFKFYSTGNLLREIAQKEGVSIFELQNKMRKDSSIDKKLDDATIEFSITKTDFIFDSWLAWYFIKDSFKIKLKCDDNIRFERISKRENISFEKAEETTKKREENNSLRYNEIYPKMNFPPKDDIFDLVIDTTKKNEKEIANIIMSKIN